MAQTVRHSDFLLNYLFIYLLFVGRVHLNARIIYDMRIAYNTIGRDIEGK